MSNRAPETNKPKGGVENPSLEQLSAPESAAEFAKPEVRDGKLHFAGRELEFGCIALEENGRGGRKIPDAVRKKCGDLQGGPSGFSISDRFLIVLGNYVVGKVVASNSLDKAPASAELTLTGVFEEYELIRPTVSEAIRRLQAGGEPRAGERYFPYAYELDLKGERLSTKPSVEEELSRLRKLRWEIELEWRNPNEAYLPTGYTHYFLETLPNSGYLEPLPESSPERAMHLWAGDPHNNEAPSELVSDFQAECYKEFRLLAERIRSLNEKILPRLEASWELSKKKIEALPEEFEHLRVSDSISGSHVEKNVPTGIGAKSTEEGVQLNELVLETAEKLGREVISSLRFRRRGPLPSRRVKPENILVRRGFYVSHEIWRTETHAWFHDKSGFTPTIADQTREKADQIIESFAEEWKLLEETDSELLEYKELLKRFHEIVEHEEFRSLLDRMQSELKEGEDEYERAKRKAHPPHPSTLPRTRYAYGPPKLYYYMDHEAGVLRSTRSRQEAEERWEENREYCDRGLNGPLPDGAWDAKYKHLYDNVEAARGGGGSSSGRRTYGSDPSPDTSPNENNQGGNSAGSGRSGGRGTGGGDAGLGY